MLRRSLRRPVCEQLEFRRLLSGTYVVSEVSDFAFSQPLINYFVRGTPNGPPAAFDDGTGNISINRSAFLDTGTSGIILSKETTDTLDIFKETSNGSPVTFTDIGISGGSNFYVSEPLYFGIASTNDPNADPPQQPNGTYDLSAYTQNYGPFVNELNPTADPNNFFGDYTDIFGMPAMQGKVVVMDPTITYTQLADMSTYIYNPGTPYNAAQRDTNPGIPTANMLSVKMSYGNFAPYTELNPPNATPPVLFPNPIIGPNPLHAIDPGVPVDTTTPPVEFSNGSYSATGSFLFDTGAQISFMSQNEAANLHIHYKPGTYLSQDPQLVDDNGNPVPNQEQIPIEGVDGQVVNAAAFVMDSLTLQTQQGVQIRFTGVPIMVLDVGVTDFNTGQTLILDGDFGANFLMASMNGGNDAAFNFITFDQPNGLLNFQPAGSVSQGTASVVAHKIFYNNSAWDGNNTAANVLDDNAIAPDKSVLTAGHAPGFANFSSYSKGINGIMIDVANLAFAPNASDFTVQVGNSNNASNWILGPTPTITVRPGAGVNGSSRVELTWPDGTIKNEWVAITVKADANTGLAAPDSFFFGNLVGASGQGTLGTAYTISVTDLTAAQNDLHTFMNPAGLNDTQDYNRDGRVDATDQIIARYTSGTTLVMLNSTITGVSPAAAASSLVSTSQTTSTSTSGSPLNAHKLAFRLRKQRVLTVLQHRLKEASLIRNPRQRAHAQALLRAEIAAVRVAKPPAQILAKILK